MDPETIDKFRIGQDFALALDAVQGDVGTVSSISAKLRSVQILSGGKISFTDVVAPIELTVSPREPLGDDPAGWNLTGTAEQSANLSEGLYGIDAMLDASGSINMTSTTALVEFTRSAVS